MEFGIFDFLRILGSLGVFLFGMKMMSEALQKVAGDQMRSILSAMTSNRVLGVLTGVLVTAVIQSSSATTVMVVSFVNAGLLSLVQAIGVIMGANIGTTTTAWLISILGFKVKMSAIALPLIGIGFPLTFSSRSKLKSWGEFIVGFSILFIGLGFLKSAVPDVRGNPEAIEFIKEYANLGFLSVGIFVVIGSILTIVIQSSSATMALTIILCTQGLIPFEMAAAMVLGENIGTTITANVAALVANTAAKRAAFAHFLFNTLGVIWILVLFYPFLNAIDWAVQNWVGEASPFVEIAAIPVALSLFHTSFNIINTFVWVWFVKAIAQVSKWVMKEDETDDEVFRLEYISSGLVEPPAAAILQAQKETENYANLTKALFTKLETLYHEIDNKTKDQTLKKVQDYQERGKKMKADIGKYLERVAEEELSDDEATNVRLLLQTIDNLERIGEEIASMAKLVYKQQTQNLTFSIEMKEGIEKLLKIIKDAITTMGMNLIKWEASLEDLTLLAEALKHTRKELRENRPTRVLEDNTDRAYESGIVYNHLIFKAELLGFYIRRVVEGLATKDM